MAKRTLDSFFAPSSKKSKPDSPPTPSFSSSKPVPNLGATPAVPLLPPLASLFAPSYAYPTYPFPVPSPVLKITTTISELSSPKGKPINGQPDLDLMYYKPFIPREIEKDIFEYLRGELFFYRVRYPIKRFGVETFINTPRFTTVFGLDSTAKFSPSHSNPALITASTPPYAPIPEGRYNQSPRPIPPFLNYLRQITEAATNASYNFCLVNYYSSGNDSISYHSDDESFLGNEPSIASFSLGGERDFLMRHKPHKDTSQQKNGDKKANGKASGLKDLGSLKLSLGSGDMVLMKGKTQANWLHSIPKRKGKGTDMGRINITFRKAVVPGGTNNYYRYNVGDGEVYKWDRGLGEMREWRKGRSVMN